jgi:hypothetical protein
VSTTTLKNGRTRYSRTRYSQRMSTFNRTGWHSLATTVRRGMLLCMGRRTNTRCRCVISRIKKRSCKGVRKIYSQGTARIDQRLHGEGLRPGQHMRRTRHYISSLALSRSHLYHHPRHGVGCEIAGRSCCNWSCSSCLNRVDPHRPLRGTLPPLPLHTHTHTVPPPNES